MNIRTRKPALLLILIVLAYWAAAIFSTNSPVQAQSTGTVFLPLILAPNTNPVPEPTPVPTPVPTPGGDSASSRINMPAFTWFGEAAIAWFGRVDPTSNYADIRIGYGETALQIDVHIFDRRVWYDETPSVSDLTHWDAVTLYLNTQGNQASNLDQHAYQFTAQYRWWEDEGSYQASYQGSPSGWQPASLPFTSMTVYEGDVPNNDVDDRGWFAVFEIPYTSLGITTTPAEGTIWGMAVAVHDRDDLNGSAIPDQKWVPGADPSNPSTWGQIRFGLPAFSPPQATGLQTITIRHELNGAVVQDADVGGDTICGEPYNPDFFNGWGDANYAGSVDLNVQNQYNVADWPCFSKAYITFPLESIPAGKVILSADLVFYQFGNSDPENAQYSLIQALTVGSDWDESTITWNNAPPALENVSQAYVDPLQDYPGVPGVERRWDVSRAANQAYQGGIPLRLALYSADWSMHSGKYFRSSDVDVYMAEARPALIVTYGNP